LRLTRCLTFFRATVWATKLTAVGDRDSNIAKSSVAEVFKLRRLPVHTRSIALLPATENSLDPDRFLLELATPPLGV
jgi:hypothetical protein